MDGIRDATGCKTMVNVLRLAEDSGVWQSVAAYVKLDVPVR